MFWFPLQLLSETFLILRRIQREEQRLEAAQIKLFRHLLGITKLDKEKNQCIRQKTGAQNIVEEIKQYQKKWLQHVQRMDRNRIPKQALRYRPKGQRNIGRPKKWWRDQLHFEDQGIGNTPNPSWWLWLWWRIQWDIIYVQSFHVK